jgi:EAL domain-containing protein (putative c-di-GMP-specific phosphodiesterase class I)
VLEVTEDEAVKDLKIANDVAAQLRTMHCTLALDDFGNAYSSLARLRQLPFSELKIDRSYVTNCHADRFNAGLCETIVELSKRFGLKTVAEGIETTHESHKLQGIGCDVGQGYLFAKPMSKEHFLGTVDRRLVGKAPPTPRRSMLRSLFAKA